MSIIETDRLVLRPLTEEDDGFILKLLNEPSFLEFIGDKGVRTLEDARRYIVTGPMDSYRRHRFGLLLVQLKETGAPIGICGLIKRDYLQDKDIGFAFLPECCSKGYATESARAVLQWGVTNIGLQRVAAITQANNHLSIRVLEKLGLRFEDFVTVPGEKDRLLLYACSLDSPSTSKKDS
ncbi:MAG: GNAT family N-acetyltransferase [Bacteroidetes bacterium]|nr:GNAT family N-acetyltransferase [Bacteroidota bacterium]